MAPFAQALEHSDSFHVRQAQVENDHIRRALGGFGDALLAGGGFGDAVAVGLQAYAQQAANLQFVVNDQGKWVWEECDMIHELASTATGGALARGRRMVKTAPPAGRFSALTLPPWASTNPLTIARPRPVPPAGAAGAR